MINRFFLFFAICNSFLCYPLGITDYFSCDNQHLVKWGETCNTISSKYGISLSFLKWKNPQTTRFCPWITPGVKLCTDIWI